MNFKLTPGLFFFAFLLVASVGFSDLLNRIEDQEDSCMEMRIWQSETSISLRFVPLLNRLDELREIPDDQISQRTKEAVDLSNQLKSVDKETKKVCSEASRLKRITAFVQAIVTALLALVGIFAGYWLAVRNESLPIRKLSKRSSSKSGKKT